MGVQIDEQEYGEFEDELAGYLDKVDDQQITDVLKIGAQEFKDDLSKLAAPRSRINKGSYTHMLDRFAIRQEGVGWLVGWGKYYGPILEHGWKNAGSGRTSSHSAISHFKPVFRANEEKYYKDMIAFFHN